MYILLIFLLSFVLVNGEQSNQKILQSSIEATLMKYFDVKEDEVSFMVKSVRYDFEKQIATFDLEAILHLEMILRTDENVASEKQRRQNNNKSRKGRRSVLNATDSGDDGPIHTPSWETT